MNRDTRIDFFRGLALLVMCVDHGEEISGIQALSYFTYAPVGITTAGELFIFLSGVSLALACVPALERHGYLVTHARCVARAWQLYLVHVLALALTVAVITLLPALLGTDTVPLSQSIRTTNSMLARFATLRANPRYFDILPLYIVLLLALPPLFILLGRSWQLGLTVAAGLYLVFHAARIALGDESVPFTQTLYYNPIAWQLLFAIGMAVGVQLRLGRHVPGLSRRQLWAAMLVLAVVAVWYKGARLNALLGLVGDVEYVSGQNVPYDIPLTDKSTLGPVRLLHFLLLTSVVVHFWPRDSRWLGSAWAAPIICCGRNALEVFVFGIVATYAVGVTMQAWSGGRGLLLGLVVLAVASSIGFAYLVAWRKAEPWRVAR